MDRPWCRRSGQCRFQQYFVKIRRSLTNPENVKRLTAPLPGLISRSNEVQILLSQEKKDNWLSRITTDDKTSVSHPDILKCMFYNALYFDSVVIIQRTITEYNLMYYSITKRFKLNLNEISYTSIFRMFYNSLTPLTKVT